MKRVGAVCLVLQLAETEAAAAANAAGKTALRALRSDTPRAM
jgi:hypothetical protein